MSRAMVAMVFIVFIGWSIKVLGKAMN